MKTLSEEMTVDELLKNSLIDMYLDKKDFSMVKKITNDDYKIVIDEKEKVKHYVVRFIRMAEKTDVARMYINGN